MQRTRYALVAFIMLLLMGVGVVACSTELTEIPAAQAEQAVPETAPVPRTAAPTTTEAPAPTTTTTEAPTTTEPPLPPTTAKPVPPTTRRAPVTTEPQEVPVTTESQEAPAPSGSGDDAFLACVRNRESRGDYSALNSSSGASGAYQYLDSTWASLGYSNRYGVSKAMYASPSQQDEAAYDTLRRVGRSPWAGPGCG